jgi:hypothetical protein
MDFPQPTLRIVPVNPRLSNFVQQDPEQLDARVADRELKSQRATSIHGL